MGARVAAGALTVDPEDEHDREVAEGEDSEDEVGHAYPLSRIPDDSRLYHSADSKIHGHRGRDRVRRGSRALRDGRRPPRPRDEAERVTRGVGIDVLAVEFCRAQCHHSLASGGGILDHDVEVDLLRYRGIRPGRWLVTRSKLERQAGGRIAGGDDNPVGATVCNRQPEQGRVEGG
jgi:hypothetical protein